MKKALIIFALISGLMSCGDGKTASDAESPERDRVEVVYFHGKQRRATCMAIEKNTEELVNSMFADELKNGSVVFRKVDISTPEGEAVADKYEVTWSSLFVNEWENGNESRNNMTEFGFGNARNNPEYFKKELAEKIHQSLK